ncbi:MAG TPA: PepSY domain-containing protein [Iamia sp.]|jgi:uncharacterized membrane protein YkoI|nr:PepSY domain-containing protein [Iamia sp.]
MPAATTNRRLLIVLAAVGVLAGLVGIGASIAGVDDDREETSPSTSSTSAAATTTAPPAEEDEEATEEAAEAQLEADAAVSRTEAEQIARGQVPGPVDRARIGDEGGTVTWEVRIDGESGHTDVLIDATTGAILEIDD